MAEVLIRNEFLTACMNYVDSFVPKYQLSRVIIEMHQLLKTDSLRIVYKNASKHDATQSFQNTIKDATALSAVEGTFVDVNLNLLDTEIHNLANLVCPPPSIFLDSWSNVQNSATVSLLSSGETDYLLNLVCADKQENNLNNPFLSMSS